MGRTFKTGATALVGIMAAVSTAVAAPAAKCAKPVEVTAIQAAAIQQELMVAALTCNQIDRFNAFQTGYNSELRASDATLQKMFRRLYGGRQGQAEYHAFKTRLANDSSIRSIHDNPTYCAETAQVFQAALDNASRPTLAVFVSGIAVTEESPVDSCEIRVAVGLGGAGVPAIVPKPNPLRVAMLTPAETTPAQAVAPPQQAAPQAADAKDAQKPDDKKKSDGWLSGIFN